MSKVKLKRRMLTSSTPPQRLFNIFVSQRTAKKCFEWNLKKNRPCRGCRDYCFCSLNCFQCHTTCVLMGISFCPLINYAYICTCARLFPRVASRGVKGPLFFTVVFAQAPEWRTDDFTTPFLRIMGGLFSHSVLIQYTNSVQRLVSKQSKGTQHKKSCFQYS